MKKWDEDLEGITIRLISLIFDKGGFTGFFGGSGRKQPVKGDKRAGINRAPRC